MINLLDRKRGVRNSYLYFTFFSFLLGARHELQGLNLTP